MPLDTGFVGARHGRSAAPSKLAGAFAVMVGRQPRLADCLTRWLTCRREMTGKPGSHLASPIPRLAAPVILVTIEVGSGSFPENALARALRDSARFANRRVTVACN
jgi:adenosyl cobinamide kinase/adenosyl cobinamide phosphate guanylyltransferase